MTAAIPPLVAQKIERVRRLAAAGCTLGEIAHRLALDIQDLRHSVDVLHIQVIRDDQRGQRTIMAYRQSASAHAASLRAERAVVFEHKQRIAKARPMTRAEEDEAIRRHLAEKGVTKCPSATAEGASGEVSVFSMKIGGKITP